MFNTSDSNAVDFSYAINAEKSTAFSYVKNDLEIERAVIVHCFLNQVRNEEDLTEFKLLAESAQVDIVNILTTSRKTPHIKYFLGQGKAEELSSLVKEKNIQVILFNHSLSPAQTRNLESLCQCRVVDRTGLILDIFAQRARSHEGKLQVELAQLNHLASRLVRRKTGLDQQKGAVGLRGPGETQLETDKRLIKVRINQLKSRLAKVETQRQQNRQTRQKAEIPTISLVGYTNAGKSSLFNRLTQSNVYAADQLFATLDPTLRRLTIKDVGATVLADTVGFIRQLPHDLISAFKSTLQETCKADLLLHVIDCADPRQLENIDAVQQVLQEIGAEEIPNLLIFNKIDLLDNMRPHIEYDAQQRPVAVYLSAQNGEGIDLLLQAIQAHLKNEMVELKLTLAPAQGKLRHKLYELNAIKAEKIDDQGNFQLHIYLDQVQWLKLQKQENLHFR
ncbi:GTPase HflX [[Haemophilus] felis]|uniref:GTPase HflX n=1 Tax=[Haemophilus] felis TaxID=123822 RepID=A0A1T0B7Y2_9PAST|nr:GTPase HflX [[Haemophilus] felis]NBI40772.1 GTPase HflX [[Haemophilus] felis]NBI42814.1 GTPase HflX [[Haemophilus] felis]OOS06184.1 GTPase HflX [[Haemophilus] felis]